MAKASKATKKFQNKHLKHTLDHRREVQKQNKKFALRKKPKSSPTDENTEKPAPNAKSSLEVFNDIPMDEFFEKGFEVPKEKKSKALKPQEPESSSSDDEDEVEAMKKQMSSLAEKDPEFYKYLENEDKELLDFEGVNPLDAISEDEDEEEGEEEDDQSEIKDQSKKAKSKAPKAVEKVEITRELVKKWSLQIDKPTIKTLKNVVIAFKAAVNVNVSDDGDFKYMVTDPNAFGDLMMLAVKKLPNAIQKLVKYKVHSKTGSRSIPQENSTATKIAAILKSHASSLMTMLKDITNTENAALILASIQELLPYYISHRRLLKHMLSSVVDVWATTTEIDTQIASFAFLNNAAKEFPKSLLETILKLTYSTFLQNCRKTNVHTMALINFCKNSAAELFGIDETVSYQVGFEYVRQLAIHLRNSMNATSNAKDGYKTIYNWQYCHSLDFWSRVLAQRCNPEIELTKFSSKESPLRQLIYPLVQVTLGAIRLIPTAQFFPLRFYLIRSLLRLSQSTGVFIPVFPLLNEVLASTAISKAPKNVSLEAVDFDNNIKVTQAYLGTRVYQEGLCEQFVELSCEFFALYCKSIAFPELATPAVLALRRFIKKSRNARFNKQLSQVVEKLNANATFITGKRANVEYGPSNKTEVQQFLNDLSWEKTPFGQYVVVQRQTREEKQRVLRESLAENEKAQAEMKKKAREDSDIEMDDIQDEDDDVSDNSG